MRNNTIASIGFPPAGLLRSFSAVSTAASMSPRKLSHGTSRSIASSGSPFAESAVSRLSASKNPNCPIVPLQESCRQAGDSHGSKGQAIFRGALKLILGILTSLFKSRAKLEAGILVLRQQINVLRRGAPKRSHLNNLDRVQFVWLYHLFPSVLDAIAIIRPETIVRWHRAGFRAYWRWQTKDFR